MSSEAILTPIPAGCRPENQTVKLRTSDDVTLYHFPSCTRVERCGGCCTKDDLLSCQPTESDLLNFRVKFVSLNIWCLFFRVGLRARFRHGDKFRNMKHVWIKEKVLTNSILHGFSKNFISHTQCTCYNR